MKKLALLPVVAFAAVAFASPANAADSMPSSERVSVSASQAAKHFDANVITLQPSKGPAKCGTTTFGLDAIKKGDKSKGASKGKGKSKGKKKDQAHYVGTIVHEGPGLTPYSTVTEPPALESTTLPIR